jgi:hypothetical protein
MIILNKPYVSDFLVKTINKNIFSVLDNEIARKYFPQERLTKTNDAVDEKLFYSNSENSIDWVLENMPESDLAQMIKISKDKALFREKLKPIYPDYFFKEVGVDELKELDTESLKFPFVLKPTVGFLSFGVYPIKNKEDWQKTLDKIDLDIERFKNIFPQSVVDTNKFLIEEMIDGEEYAIDGYFDENNEATILNIFLHPFFNDKDVSDRAYYTSKKIIEENLYEFKQVLDKVGKACNYKNFPFHLELRKNDKNIIPIELNPIRMCGWCITDIAYYAWGINVYEYYFNQLKPDWDEILKKASDDYFYFTLGDIPSNINRSEIKEIDYDNYLKNIEKPLSIRKIDYSVNPLFVIVFGQTPNLEEIKNLLNLDMAQFVK